MHFEHSPSAALLHNTTLNNDQPGFGYWVTPTGDRIIVAVRSVLDATEVTNAVVVIVQREGTDRRILWIGEAGPFPGGLLMQKGVMRAIDSGATEIHVHASTQNGAERRALVERLQLWNESVVTLNLAA